MIYNPILENSVGIISDRCPTQVAANQDFIKKIYEEINIALVSLNCFMHTTSNVEKRFCMAFEKHVPDMKTALHKLKLIF